MRVVVAGGTGFIGRALVDGLARDGHDVIVLTRRAYAEADGGGGATARGRGSPSGGGGAAAGRPGSPAGGGGRVRRVHWDPSSGAIVRAVDGADAVVNLAGETIARRWTARAKRLIVASRVDATRTLAESMQVAEAPPRVFVSASAVGYYGPCGDEFVTESSPAGEDFLAHVCRRWEAEAERAGTGKSRAGKVGAGQPDEMAHSGMGGERGTRDSPRVVLARIGLVLGDGGALGMMALPFRLFVGGPLGSGRQWMPWIHIDDVVGMISFAIKNEAVQGPLNVTGPQPVQNREFARIMGRVLKRPAVIPTPAFAIRAVLGEMSDMVLTGQRAVPEKAVSEGFRFRYGDAEAALQAVWEPGNDL